eukprot:COSAG05_NODE_19_length_34900_cov_72.237464_17_plen_114_part_00
MEPKPEPEPEPVSAPAVALMDQPVLAPPEQVLVKLLAVGSAPRLKKTKFQVGGDKTFAFVINFLRKQLKAETVFVYLNQAFSPSPDTPLAELYLCFSVDNALVISYCVTEAYG